jgi:hypothetical protein
MKYALAFIVAVLATAAAGPGTALACEGCVRATEVEPTAVACFEAPDGPGEICTSGGGYCNEEGTCSNNLAGDGSLVPVAGTSVQLTAAGGQRAETVKRRECDRAVIARFYDTQQAAHLRTESVLVRI